jgi:hypothetical protein
MNSTEFVNYFNLIKPTRTEIETTDPSLSSDVVEMVLGEYSLELISDKRFNDNLVDLVENTNISDLNFSPIQLCRSWNSDLNIAGQIIEKGDILIDEATGNLFFRNDEGKSLHNQYITTDEFIKFYLKFLELDFNRIFRGNAIIKATSEIAMDKSMIKKCDWLLILLDEIGVNADIL